MQTQRAKFRRSPISADAERRVQCVVITAVPRLETGARVVKRRDIHRPVRPGGIKERRAFLGIRCLRIRAMLEQDAQHRRTGLFRRNHQRGHTRLIGNLHIRTHINEGGGRA